MAKYVSNRNPVSARALKRRPIGTAVVRHYGRVDVKFTRVHGGWVRELTGEIVSSAALADECNRAVGCQSSWAKVY